MSRVSELDRLKQQVKELMDENARLKTELIRKDDALSCALKAIYDEVQHYDD